MKRPPFDPNLLPDRPEKPAAALSAPLTVSRLTALIKNALATALPPTLYVLGEVSNFKRHSSGHLYFTLKDQASELACVMWRSDAVKLKFAPQDGMDIIATGTVEVFERAGRYQLYARRLEPRGVGARELAFRQLCEKLSAEGLFDPRHKVSLPAFPSRLAIVTSPTGAAIADMLRTIERRFPCVDVLVYPVRVQGEGAAAEIAAAIRRISAGAEGLGGIDLMIVGRGGGSIEDLWAFNEEIVARAIHAARIPIISAVGHETDVTIADLVADVRAATPTAAAELAVPVRDDVLDRLASTASRLRRAQQAQANLLAARLRGITQHGSYRDPMALVRRRAQLVDEFERRMTRTLQHRVRLQSRRLALLEPVLQRIAPHAFLLRNTVSLRDAHDRLRWSLVRRLAGETRRFDAAGGRLDRGAPSRRIARLVEQLSRRAESLPSAVRHRLELAGEQVRRREEVLAALSHKSVLRRGFSITRIKRGRALLRSVEQVGDGDRVLTELTDGQFESQVVNRTQLELFD